MSGLHGSTLLTNWAISRSQGGFITFVMRSLAGRSMVINCEILESCTISSLLSTTWLYWMLPVLTGLQQPCFPHHPELYSLKRWQNKPCLLCWFVIKCLTLVFVKLLRNSLGPKFALKCWNLTAPPLDEELQGINNCWERERKLVFPGDTSLIGYLTLSGQRSALGFTGRTQQVIFTCWYIYLYT